MVVSEYLNFSAVSYHAVTTLRYPSALSRAGAGDRVSDSLEQSHQVFELLFDDFGFFYVCGG